jgi:putative transcriptional regulator
MVEILRNKNQATRLQILTEIANGGPHIQQRDIARKLNVTPQAISEYIGLLAGDGFLTLDGHSHYHITNEGVNWIIKVLKELKEYSDFIVESVANISICAAIAETDLAEGQKVALKMKDGILYASVGGGRGAIGTTISAAKTGQDIGVKNIEGIVALQTGKAVILKVPGIKTGGSARVDPAELKKHLNRTAPVGVIGIEALVALTRTGTPGYIFGVKEAVVEAAQHGLEPVVVCVEDEISGLIKKLEEKNIPYDLIDLRQELT